MIFLCFLLQKNSKNLQCHDAMSDEPLSSNVSQGMRQLGASDNFSMKLTAHSCPSPARRLHERTSENRAFFASKMSFFNQLGQ
jgi:hypothetical protein